MVRTVLPAEI